MERDAKKMRGERPFVFTNLKTGQGLDQVVEFIRREGMLPAATDFRQGSLLLRADAVRGRLRETSAMRHSPIGLFLRGAGGGFAARW